MTVISERSSSFPLLQFYSKESDNDVKVCASSLSSLSLSFIFIFFYLYLSLSFYLYLLYLLKVKVPQSCLTLYDLMDCSPPGSSVHGSFQARILEWVAIPFSRGSSPSRVETWVFCTAGRFFTI